LKAASFFYKDADLLLKSLNIMIGKNMLRFFLKYKISYTLLACLIAVLTISDYSFAGITGKIKGKIIDKDTGEPVVGANVIIDGTYFGAAADIEGEYYINNIPPGTYTVIFSAVGYNKIFVEKVSVKIDLTTDVSVEMVSEAVTLGEVVVQAERPMIVIDLTSSSAIVNSEQIKMMPVENLSQVINLQAGVVGGHFRGGRINEVAYLVDGIPINNVYDGGNSFQIENNSVRQLEVISGTFNAEYGQALSGVVNIVTQDGSQKFEGTVSAYIGNYFTTHTDIFWNLNNVNLEGPKDLQFSLSGPTKVVNNLTFFVTGRYFKDGGTSYGQRYYNIEDTAPIIPDPQGNPEYFINTNTGDSAFVQMNPYEKKSVNAKLTYSAETWKLSYSLFWDDNFNRYYNHDFRQAPDGLKNYYSTNTINNVQFSYYPLQDLFFTLKFSANSNKYKDYLYENEYDSRYVDPNFSTPISGYTYRYGGNQTDRSNRTTNSNLILFTSESQVSKEHKLKFGAEARFHEIDNSYRNLVNLTEGQLDSSQNPVVTWGYTNPGTQNNQSYIKNPYEYALYLQDKMEYDMMIINAGVRYDYFNSNTTLPVDIRNPLNNPLFPGANQTRPAVSEDQISPRLGVSFPISDEGAIHFSYGHFFQIPSFENLYANNDYLIDQTTGLNGIIGNPELKSQKTVKYEIGLQQVFFSILTGNVSIYYSDIRNLLGMEILDTYEGFQFGRYINRDYGNVKGLIITLEKRHADYFSAKLDYTYQTAQGNGSDPRQIYYNNQSDPPVEETKKLLPLNWDQTSTLNISFTVGDLIDWSIGGIFSYESGFPYTIDKRYNGGIQIENNGKKPVSLRFDLKATKTFKVFGFDFNTFLIVYNVFDFKNEYGVNPTTGRAGADLNVQEFTGVVYGLNTIDEYLLNPQDYSSPREIRLGFGVGF